MLTSKQRFLKALQCELVDRPPVWIMRQAGRYLPEYRKLKEKYDFLQLVRSPDLATEVTLQPMKRFPLDAAITFSDILVIPEALGQSYYFKNDAGGVFMEYPLNSQPRIQSLKPADSVLEHLQYVPKAQKQIRQELSEEKALLGFCGSPWTLAAYMIEGGSHKSFHNAIGLYLENRPLFNELLSKLTEALTLYIEMQIDAGVDAVQIFDSWASACPSELYPELSLNWINEIASKLSGKVPLILYCKGMGHHLDLLQQTGVQAVSLDHTMNLAQCRKSLDPKIAIQGNLFQGYMSTTPEIVREKTLELLRSMNDTSGHIMNLGHGILPSAKIECVEMFLNTITHFNPSNVEPISS